MSITSAARTAISEVLALWETGSPTGGYGTISILSDGAGFTGGVHQGTDKAGTIDRIIQTYIDKRGKYAEEFRAFQDELEANLSTELDPKNPPQWALDFMKLWRRAAGEDVWFRRAQDEVFDAQYWAPCAQQCEAMKLQLPVSWGVCYDITIQSGPAGISKMRKLFAESAPCNGGNEAQWVRAMALARRSWLANFKSPYEGEKGERHSNLVRNTVYRMDGWLDVIASNNLMLKTPFQIPLRGKMVEIVG